MSIKKNKRLILNRIKLFYSLKSDSELAKFLEVAPTTISSWVSRDTIDYDLIFSKCVGINLDWLLTGNEESIKSDKKTLPENSAKKINKSVDGIKEEFDKLFNTEKVKEDLKHLRRIRAFYKRFEKELENENPDLLLLSLKIENFLMLTDLIQELFSSYVETEYFKNGQNIKSNESNNLNTDYQSIKALFLNDLKNKQAFQEPFTNLYNNMATFVLEIASLDKKKIIEREGFGI